MVKMDVMVCGVAKCGGVGGMAGVEDREKKICTVTFQQKEEKKEMERRYGKKERGEKRVAPQADFEAHRFGARVIR